MSDDKLTPKGEDEVRAEVIEKYELDEDLNEELVTKLTQDQLALQKKEFEAQKALSKTIEQKAKYRELGVKAGLLDPETFEPIEKPEGNKGDTPEINKLTEKNDPESKELRELIYAQMKIEADDAEMIDKIKRLNGTTTLQAMEDPLYKTYLKSKEERLAQEKAQLKTSSGGGGGISKKKEKTMTRDEHYEAWKKATQG